MLDDFPTLRAQRESFRAAAAREMDATSQPRQRRRLRRAAITAAAALLGAGGVAAATELISIGQPEDDPIERRSEQLPAASYAIAVTAADTPLPWAAGVYRAKGGPVCVIAGQRRGTRLGLTREGTFRPYEPGTAGTCQDAGPDTTVVDQRLVANRYLVYGLAQRRARSVEFVERSGERRVARTGRAGAFLFVYDDTTTTDDFREIIVRDAAGRRLP